MGKRKVTSETGADYSSLSDNFAYSGSSLTNSPGNFSHQHHTALPLNDCYDKTYREFEDLEGFALIVHLLHR